MQGGGGLHDQAQRHWELKRRSGEFKGMVAISKMDEGSWRRLSTQALQFVALQEPIEPRWDGAKSKLPEGSGTAG